MTECMNAPVEKEWTSHDILEDCKRYDRKAVAKRYCITAAQVRKIEEQNHEADGLHD